MRFEGTHPPHDLSISSTGNYKRTYTPVRSPLKETYQRCFYARAGLELRPRLTFDDSHQVNCNLPNRSSGPLQPGLLHQRQERAKSSRLVEYPHLQNLQSGFHKSQSVESQIRSTLDPAARNSWTISTPAKFAEWISQITIS